MEITKDEFKEYVRVRDSGVTNMFDVKTVETLSGLDRDKIMQIMKEFGVLQEKYK